MQGRVKPGSVAGLRRNKTSWQYIPCSQCRSEKSGYNNGKREREREKDRVHLRTCHFEVIS